MLMAVCRLAPAGTFTWRVMLGYVVLTLRRGRAAGVALPYDAPVAPGGTGVVLPAVAESMTVIVIWRRRSRCRRPSR